MHIDRSTLERELENIRQQQQQMVRAVEQATGAEKAVMAMLSLLDKKAAEVPPAGDAE